MHTTGKTHAVCTEFVGRCGYDSRLWLPAFVRPLCLPRWYLAAQLSMSWSSCVVVLRSPCHVVPSDTPSCLCHIVSLVSQAAGLRGGVGSPERPCYLHGECDVDYSRASTCLWQHFVGAMSQCFCVLRCHTPYRQTLVHIGCI